jgi:predicted Abi (CAAX) family protease
MVEFRQQKDCQERHREFLRIATLLAVLALASLQVYRGVTADPISDAISIRTFGTAGVLVGGIVLYFTSYWRPSLYVISALFVGSFTMFRVLLTPMSLVLEAIRVTLGGALFVLFFVLFYKNRTRPRGAGS